LSHLEFFINFQLDEHFNERILSRYRDEFSYGNFSEGEKRRIDLALLFTWREIAKLKNSIQTNLLIMDEVLDGSLDGDGIMELLKIIDDMKGTNVFIISHRMEISDKFQSNLQVTKPNNFSMMKAA
jgi:energy-coupling factor transporter ATP-binding protein EcfA2